MRPIITPNQRLFLDFDGTLIDISEKYYQIYREFMRTEHRAPLPKLDYWQRKRQKASAEELLIDPSLVAAYQTFFLDRIEHEDYLKFDRPFDGVDEVLTVLNKQQRALYLVTLRRHPETLFAQIDRLGLRRYFTGIVTAAPVPFAADNNYRYKIELLTPFVSPGDVIVGDSQADIRSGQALGLTTVGVLSGISSEPILQEAKPDYLIPKVTDLTKFIN